MRELMSGRLAAAAPPGRGGVRGTRIARLYCSREALRRGSGVGSGELDVNFPVNSGGQALQSASYGIRKMSPVYTPVAVAAALAFQGIW